MGEQAWPQSWKAPKDSPAETPEVLYLRYHGYRRRQATRLLHVMPREAVRDLYGQAREWAKGRGLHDGQDPMATLVRFAEHLLPLPPFEVWLADREQYPLCHIEDSNEGPHGPHDGAAGSAGGPAVRVWRAVMERVSARIPRRNRVAGFSLLPGTGPHSALPHSQHFPRGDGEGGAKEVQGVRPSHVGGVSPLCLALNRPDRDPRKRSDQKSSFSAKMCFCRGRFRTRLLYLQLLISLPLTQVSHW